MPRPTLPILVVILALGLALTGCGTGGGGGGGGGAAGSGELPGIEKTTVSAGAPERFAASSWGFPTSGTAWSKDTETEVEPGGTTTEIEFRKRTSATGTPTGSAVAGVVTSTEIYEQDGELRRTSHGAWTIGDNDVIYIWSPYQARWFPFAPARVTAGQRWRMPMDAEQTASSTLRADAHVVSTDATSPNGHTGCIRVEFTTRLLAPTTGDVVFTKLDSDQTWWVKPGLGTVYRLTHTLADGTVWGIPFSDDESHVIELLPGAPTFLPTAVN